LLRQPELNMLRKECWSGLQEALDVFEASFPFKEQLVVFHSRLDCDRRHYFRRY
jgi:hypothetical protein